MGVRRELEPDVLLGAYADGIFPMADESGEIEWFSPDPRAILPLDGFRVSNNLRRTVRSGRFDVQMNGDFAGVMRACAERDEGTWISAEIIEAYTRLHALGFGYSVEAHRNGSLVGGLYGVALGGAFFGESMFHRETDASKVALVHLVERMKARGFTLLDVQFMTPHLRQFGTIEIPRKTYLARLQSALRQRCVFAD